MNDMLTDQDIKRIGEEVASVIEHNINPQFESVSGRLDKIEVRLDRIEGRMDGAELRMDTVMVTKSYLDEKLAPIKGKINVLVDVLHQNKTISDDQRRVIHA